MDGQTRTNPLLGLSVESDAPPPPSTTKRRTPRWLPVAVVACAGVALAADVPLLPGLMRSRGVNDRRVPLWIGLAQAACWAERTSGLAVERTTPAVRRCKIHRKRPQVLRGAMRGRAATRRVLGRARPAALRAPRTRGVGGDARGRRRRAVGGCHRAPPSARRPLQQQRRALARVRGPRGDGAIAATLRLRVSAKTGRSDAAGATRRFREDGSRRRRGRDAEIPQRRVAATPRVPRGDSAKTGDAAGATWIFRRRIAATPRVPHGYSGDGSRRRRGCHMDIPRRRAAATPRLPLGKSGDEQRPPLRGTSADRASTLGPRRRRRDGPDPRTRTPRALDETAAGGSPRRSRARRARIGSFSSVRSSRRRRRPRRPRREPSGSTSTRAIRTRCPWPAPRRL